MLRRVLAIAFAAALVGCDSTDPSPIAGTWVATEFVITEEDAEPADVLDAGGSLTITVAGNNSTSGTLTIPASLAGGETFTASMAGTAGVAGSSVTFAQSADTFVRDVTWTIVGNTLTATDIFAGTVFEITLTRQ